MQYKQLKEFIENRRKFEIFRPSLPRTTVDFYDVEGKTLLHRAAEEGLLDEVKQLLTNEKADINRITLSQPQKSALLLAVESNQFEIAKYLCEQGANLSGLLKVPLKNTDFLNWIKHFVNQKMQHTIDWQRMEILTQPFCFHLPNEKNNSWLGVLCAAIYLGDKTYLEKSLEFFIRHSNRPISEISHKLLEIAVAQGNLEAVQYLLQQACNVNPKATYANTPLHQAIISNQPKIVDYLLSQGADVKQKNQSKHDAMMLAVAKGKPEIVNQLLAKGAAINFETTDIEGNTLLHLAVQSGNIHVLRYLLSYPDAVQHIFDQNIYGQSVLNLAVKKNRPEILAEFSAKGVSEFPGPYKDMPVIAQSRIIRKMYFYLTMKYRGTQYFPVDGKCNGFSYLYHYYGNLDKEDYFFSTLEKLANWNGSQEALEKPFETGSLQAKYYENLGEVFEQWINDILWFQNSGLPTSLLQGDRFGQHSIIDNKESAPICLTNLKSKSLKADAIAEIITFFSRMPAGMSLECAGNRHVTSGFLDKDKTIHYYDPNFTYRTTVTNAKETTNRIINFFKYIAIEEIQSSHLIFRFSLTSDQRNRLHNLSYRIFSDEEYPKTLEEAKKFQENSPNQFTHLHIAVLTRSAQDIENLLNSKCCDINAKDCFGKTAFELAMENNFPEVTEMFLKHTYIDIPFKLILKNYIDRDQENKASENFYSSDLIYQFIVAIKYNQSHLFPIFLYSLREKGIDLKKNDGFKLLNYAIEYNHTSLIYDLLKVGAPWSGVMRDEEKFSLYRDIAPMEKVIIDYPAHLPLLLSTIGDVNTVKTADGNTLIHLAVKNCSIEALEQLLKNNVDLQVKNNQGDTPLAMLLNANVNIGKDEKTFCHIVEKIINSPQFTIDANKETLFGLMTLSMNKDWDSLFNLLLNFINPQIIDQKTNGFSALFIKALEAKGIGIDSLKYMQKLSDKGLNPGQSEKAGNTFAHVIVSNFEKFQLDERYITELLLTHGFNLDVKNNQRKTVIELAREKIPNLIHLFEKGQETVGFQGIFTLEGENKGQKDLYETGLSKEVTLLKKQ